SGRRDSNPRPRPWQGRALPLSYTRVFNHLATGQSFAAMVKSSKPDPVAAQRKLFKEISRLRPALNPPQFPAVPIRPVSNDRPERIAHTAAVVRPTAGSHCKIRGALRGLRRASVR